MHTMIKRLIECRKAAGLSQSELAEKLELSRQTISKWETGSVIPAAENLSALAKLYKVSLDWLVNGEESVRQQTEGETAPQMEEESTQTAQLQKAVKRWRFAALVLAAMLLAAAVFAGVRYWKTTSEASEMCIEQQEIPEHGSFDVIWNLYGG